MKVAGISDLHGYLPDNIPTCNVLCISGDIIPLNIQRNNFASLKWWLKNFCEWVSRLPCEKVIFTAGNHDFLLEQLYQSNLYPKFVAMLEQHSNDKAILLINELYTYKGVKFYGFPYIIPIGFQIGKWAFEDKSESAEDIGEYFTLVNIQTDVLITHDNPFKNTKLKHYLTCEPKVWFYGHWHEGKSNKALKLYNCSVRDDYYNIKENFELPIVEIDTRDSTVEEIFSTMLENIGRFTALRHYDNFQVNAIKDFLIQSKEFLLKQKEDDIPLPITGEVIDEHTTEIN